MKVYIYLEEEEEEQDEEESLRAGIGVTLRVGVTRSWSRSHSVQVLELLTPPLVRKYSGMQVVWYVRQYVSRESVSKCTPPPPPPRCWCYTGANFWSYTCANLTYLRT